MHVDDVVRVYEGEWFNEGHVTEVDDESVTVDFLDWVQRYARSDLSVQYIFYQKVLVAPANVGVTIQDFR